MKRGANRVDIEHKSSGLLAQSCNPATGEQGYLDTAGHLGLLTWLGRDWLVPLLNLETQVEADLHKRTCPDHKEPLHCTGAV